jgi:hypothetical protein
MKRILWLNSYELKIQVYNNIKYVELSGFQTQQQKVAILNKNPILI